MSATSTAPIIAQKPFAAIFVVLAFMLAVIAGVRLAGYKPPPTIPDAAPVATRVLRVEDGPTGVVIVHDAKTGQLLKTFTRGEGSFLRATLRALVNDRKRKGATLEGDFRLEAHAGNQLYLIDESTGKTLSMNAFGPDNTAVFAAFMSNQKQGEGQ